MYKCNKCGVEKNMSEYHLDPVIPGGYKKVCKECCNYVSRVRYRKLFATEKKISNQKRDIDYNRMMAKRGMEKYPEKYKTRYITKNTIRLGKIVKKPCEVCGEEKVHCHHTDYSNPFAIQWLCPKHHRMAHWKPIPSDLLNH